MNKELTPVTFTRKVKPIKLFDILIEDIHSAGDKPNLHTIDTTVGLTYHEVLEWISSGGEWDFKVTEHNNPENVFMFGTSLQNMDDARKGEENLLICHASESEIEDFSKVVDRKRRKEYGLK